MNPKATIDAPQNVKSAVARKRVSGRSGGWLL
jgi:hypothetical protein